MVDNMKKGLSKSLSYLSVVIPIITIFIFINYFTKIVPFLKLSNISLFFPLYTSIIGTIVSIISVKLNGDKTGKIGLILNVSILMTQILFILFGIMFLVR